MNKLIQRLAKDLRALQYIDRVSKFGADSDSFYKPGSNAKCLTDFYKNRFGKIKYEYQF
jgi:hypothetical protein